MDKIGLRDINRSQRHIIPAVLTRKNIILVDAPGSGKTVGCLIPLITLLRETKENKVCYLLRLNIRDYVKRGTVKISFIFCSVLVLVQDVFIYCHIPLIVRTLDVSVFN